MPLVGVTADRRWQEQADLFARRGIDVLHGPTMRTVDLAGDPALRAVTEALVASPPDVVVATTGAGMRQWFEAADSWGRREALLAALSGAVVVARGAKASSAVRQAGLPVAWRAPNESMAEVVDHVSGLPSVGTARVALQLFDPDEHPTTAALRAVAGSIVEVPVYRWLPPGDVEPAVRLIDAAVTGSLDAVTFTSQPAVHFLLRIAEAAGGGRADALRSAANSGSMLVACIGPVCAEACTEEGLHDVVWPEPFRLPPLVRLVADRIGAGAGSGGAVAPPVDQG